MLTTVGAYEAKKHLLALLERVRAGGRIVTTKHGRAVARLVPYAEGPRRPIADILADLTEHRVPLATRDRRLATVAEARGVELVLT